MESAKFLESADDFGAAKFLGSEDECSMSFNQRESPFKVRFLESEAESDNNNCLQRVTSNATANGRRQSTANTNRRRANAIRRSRSRRSMRNESDNSDDDYLPVRIRGSVRRSPRRPRARSTRSGSQDFSTTNQLCVPPTASVRPTTPTIRQRSTRSEARRATLRIHMIDVESTEEEEGSFEEESVVHVDEISMASDDHCEKFLTDDDGTNNTKYSCIICAELEAIRPVKTTCCAQPLGCKTCVKRWYRTTNISELNSRSPLSRGQSHDNHKRCPFCRTPWPMRMLIVAV